MGKKRLRYFEDFIQVVVRKEGFAIVENFNMLFEYMIGEGFFRELKLRIDKFVKKFSANTCKRILLVFAIKENSLIRLS